ncbi:MAG: UxaA family hydrolase, partial [Erysipelotrichaceae bacterium]|nr:UxaA family hydrolase [Erysipelotrichaceae bacterium]
MKLIRINETDNVAVAVDKIPEGVELEGVVTLSEIPMGHKVALKDIKENEDIVKYGQVIGVASKDIRKGEHVHSHNMHTKLSGELEYTFDPVGYSDKTAENPYKLYGYRRENGKVGIRNELWLVPTVGCISSICKDIIQRFKSTHDLSDIDGAYTFGHQYGCSQMGDDQDATIKVLQNIACHPNAGAVLVVGLGCENNQLKPFIEGLKGIDPKRLRYFNCQEVDDEVEVALNYLEELYELMRHDRREPIEFKDLVIGLECGGSDGFSGISGNPLLGRLSDRVISYGGNVILSEVPEMFGAEHLLMNRAKDKEVFE